MRTFVELVTFTAKAGVTSEQVVSAAEQVNLFLKSQPGFVSRNLGVTSAGTWYDILYWETRDLMTAAMAQAESSPHCAGFFGLIVPDHNSMALFSTLVTAGREK